MKDFEIMEHFEGPGDLDKDVPDLVFLEVLFFLLVLENFLVEVASIGKLHHDTSAIHKITIDFCPPETLPCTRLYWDILWTLISALR